MLQRRGRTRSRGCGREELLVVPIKAAGIRTTSPVTRLPFGARGLAAGDLKLA